jgi:hypothetical protein
MPFRRTNGEEDEEGGQEGGQEDDEEGCQEDREEEAVAWPSGLGRSRDGLPHFFFTSCTPIAGVLRGGNGRHQRAECQAAEARRWHGDPFRTIQPEGGDESMAKKTAKKKAAKKTAKKAAKKTAKKKR